jgi:hypothetical protein
MQSKWSTALVLVQHMKLALLSLWQVLLAGPGTANGDAADSDSFTSPSHMDSLRSDLASQSSFTKGPAPDTSAVSQTSSGANTEDGPNGRSDSFSTPVKPRLLPSQTRLELTPAVIQQLAWLLSRKRDRLSPLRVSVGV